MSIRPPAVSRVPAWLWFLLGGALLMALYVAVPPFQGSGPVINLIGLSSPVAIIIGIRLHRPAAALAWWLFAAGQFLFFAGDLYTYSYPKLLGADVPFPSLGDALYLMVYPVLMAGLIVLVRHRNPGGDRGGSIDSLILTIGVSLVSWIVLIVPNGHMSGLDFMAKAVSIAYPIGDILLLAAAIRLAVDAGKRAGAFYLLSGSIVALLATDSIYTWLLLKNQYTHQLWLDVGWMSYYLLWGAAALHPSMRTLSEPASRRSGAGLTHRRLALLCLACLIAPSVRFAANLKHLDIAAVQVAAGVLFLLVIARMLGMIRDEERAGALRSAGVELVGATSLDGIHDAASTAVERLTGAATQTRITVFTAAGCLAIGTDETPAEGGAPIVAWLDALDGTPAELPVAQVPESIRRDLDVHSGELVIFELTCRGDRVGSLIVSSPVALAHDAWETLDSLASQVALAVDGAQNAEASHRRSSEARFRSLVANSSDLISVLDPSGVVLYQSPSIEQVLGYAPSVVEGTRFELLLRKTDRPRLRQLLDDDGLHRGDRHTLECSLLDSSGEWHAFELQYANLLDDEHVGGIVLNGRDVSERRAFEEQLAHQAFHDPVTSLANRALFGDRVQLALSRALRDGPGVALMFLDLDDFKTVNDSLGHAAGDDMLREVGRRIQAHVRPNDTVARFGGDEFAILLEPVTGVQEAADAAERILTALQEPLDVGNKQTYPRASIGICLSDPGATAADADELLRNADVAMYMAKRDSKGGYRVFEPAMHAGVLERLEMRADLQRAIDEGHLEVHYQPVIRLNDEAVYGMEALLRWQHPERGSIPPLQFIPLAEETGMIVPIGRWVLNQACRQAAEFQARFSDGLALAISVNLSIRQLQADSIVDDVRDALTASGLDPASLVLEITESVMMADTDLAAERLHALKALGVRLAMDDFGTGYSSLSYLSRFPVDILKMDRSFLTDQNSDAGLAAAIVGLGDALHLDVVAEGIELPSQITTLRGLGCELGQGFLFAKALPPDELAAFLQAHGDDPQRRERAA